MLARANRLTSGEDFSRAVRAGRRAGSRTLVVHALDARGSADGPTGPARVGVVVSKAVGTAVARNRVKRRLRHLLRPLAPGLPDGALVVVRALPAAAGAGSAVLQGDLASCLARALPEGRAA